MKKRLALHAAVLSLALLIVAVPALAQPGPFELSWWTVDGGGGTSSGGDYALSGTAGQFDAGAMSGGRYGLSGGFWPETGREPHRVYLPLVSRTP